MKAKKKPSKETDFLEEIVKKVLKKLSSKKFQPRISEALRAIQLKEKMKKSEEAEKLFWEMIEEVRKEGLR
jgi:hypothetical protein